MAEAQGDEVTSSAAPSKESTQSQPTVDSSNIFWETPWCSNLLKDPSWIQRSIGRQFNPAHNDQDSFFARTLATPQALSSHLTLIPREHGQHSYPRILETIKLFALGPYLSGHEFVAHGGLVATLLDETLGILIYVNEDVEQEVNPAYELKRVMTLSLNLTYRKPVPAPGVVLGRAKVGKREGRKRWINGTIEDGNGNILTEAEALFIELKTASL